MDYGIYRTAHGAFPEAIAGEYTAFILPPSAPLDLMAPHIQNALVLVTGDAVHLLHWNRVFELLKDKQYRGTKIIAVTNGAVGAVLSDHCQYCQGLVRKVGEDCGACNPALLQKYRTLPYDMAALTRYLAWDGGRRIMAVLLYKDETFVRLRSEDIAEGRLRHHGDDQQGYNPLQLTFDWKIIRRNELIFNAEMAERTGKLQALKFEVD